MQRWLRTAAAAVAVATTAALPAVASAHDGRHDHDRGAVFVQTDDLTANAIVAYHRDDDGTLHQRGTYPTGGRGGLEVGAPVDALASQGSLVYDAPSGELFAVNAGSDTVSVFDVHGDRLRLRQVIGSGGSFPVSIAVHGRLVEVLNAGGEGILQGFVLRDGRLHPRRHGARSLGLANATPPNNGTAPGQVTFSPDGRTVLVTTKGGGTIEAFTVGRHGRLSPTAVTNPSAGPNPFSAAFDPYGHLLVSEAGADSSVSSYAVGPDGVLTALAPSVHDGQTAACWVIWAHGYLFVSNTGSASISAYAADAAGGLVDLGVKATTGGGPIDTAVSADQRFLYVQAAGPGQIEVFAIGDDASLTPIQTVTGLPAFGPAGGIEGIAAT